ncbi:hypothetical protein BX600DRAFT_468996 [Xylariales sp. PMI_506]|nr:hypothetical protein BX600DRAFT_468996 [Xylariales sp. PMI_506]
MADSKPNYILYHFTYSICSIMARYTYALRGQPSTPDGEIRLEEKVVNVMTGEQLTEQFLCEVNAYGEVPVLAPVNSGKPIPDSLAITKFIAQTYPTLIPPSHTDEITGLLRDLHAINFFSLTFTGKPQGVSKSKDILQKKLEDGSISDRYRKAIAVKIDRLNTQKLAGLEPEAVEAAETSAQALTAKLDAILRGHPKSGWLFGLEHPSALDAHVVVFIKRMLDVNRGGLIPEGVKAYAEAAMAGEAWNHVMQGRNTMP